MRDPWKFFACSTALGGVQLVFNHFTVQLKSDCVRMSELQISVLKLIAGTSFNCSDKCSHTFLYNSGRAGSEKYFCDGNPYRGSKCSSRRRKPAFLTTVRGFSSRIRNSRTFPVILTSCIFAMHLHLVWFCLVFFSMILLELLD